MDERPKRILVDMSATLLHHGHTRILKAAKALGTVVVALTTDDEIRDHKGYIPELDFDQRREILEAIRYVDEVVPCPWLIDETFLDKYQIDLLVHGNDNSNHIRRERLFIIPRTEGVSSNLLRARALESISAMIKAKKPL